MDYIIYFAITIGILVFIHELGHFIAAKMSGMRADVFAIGYGKRLFGYNRINGFTLGSLPKDFDSEGHTDYRVSMLPLGGYVKIAGMVDESFDTEFASREPQPYEFRSKPTYKKLFVISAGVLMNLLLTLIILWGINFYQGETIYKTTTVGAVADSSTAANIGFQTGDEIESVNGKKVDNWNDVINAFLKDNIGNDVAVTVKRNGVSEQLNVPENVISESAKSGFFLTFGSTQPFVSGVMENSPAEIAGIKEEDVFLRINDQPVPSTQDVINMVSSYPEKEISLDLLRDKDTVHTTAMVGFDGKIGIAIGELYTGPIDHRTYGFFGSFNQSLKNIEQITVLTLSMFKNVIVGNVQFNQVFAGPVKIAKFAARSANSGIVSFLYFLAMVSLSLAIVNFLPFPVLDGGHFVIIAIEGIRGKELPLKFKIAIQNFGFIILMLLVIFTIYSDLISL